MTPPHERRNFSKIYEKMRLSKLSEEVPAFNFTQYLNLVLPKSLEEDEEVVIYASKYFKKLTKIVEETDKRVLANYILMRFIRHRINNLDKRCVLKRTEADYQLSCPGLKKYKTNCTDYFMGERKCPQDGNFASPMSTATLGCPLVLCLFVNTSMDNLSKT